MLRLILATRSWPRCVEMNKQGPVCRDRRMVTSKHQHSLALSCASAVALMPHRCAVEMAGIGQDTNRPLRDAQAATTNSTNCHYKQILVVSDKR